MQDAGIVRSAQNDGLEEARAEADPPPAAKDDKVIGSTNDATVKAAEAEFAIEGFLRAERRRTCCGSVRRGVWMMASRR